MRYLGIPFDDVPGYARLGEAMDELDAEAGQPLNRVYYLSTAPEFFPVITDGDQGERPAPVRARRGAGGDREAVRHRPRLRALAAGGRALGLPRAPGLPHRSLPGQGDGPERDGVPVRELHVRAGLEPQLHRPHPDHRGRGHRDRLARRLLRQLGRAARPRAEPHAAAADAGLHGAAGLVRGQQGARREGQGAAGDRAAEPGRGRADDRPRPLHGAAWSAAPRRPATSRRRACPPTRTPRPTRRCGWRSTTGAGRASRSCCAPASGWRAR